MTQTAEPIHPPSVLARKQRRDPVQRAADNPKSLKLAVSAMCWVCKKDGDGTPHKTKAAVRDCADTACPLWPHRGWQTVTTAKPR
jgi:hypothetical protein